MSTPTNPNMVTLQIELPNNEALKELLGEQILKTLTDYGKQTARQLVQSTMTDEINRIVEARIKEMKGNWYHDTKVGKMINESIANAVEKVAQSIGLDQKAILDELKTRVENAECYTEEKIQNMLLKQVEIIANNIGVSKKFKEDMLEAIATEVRLTYPVQIAQLIDNETQDALRKRIAELETELDAYRNGDKKNGDKTDE